MKRTQKITEKLILLNQTEAQTHPLNRLKHQIQPKVLRMRRGVKLMRKRRTLW